MKLLKRIYSFLFRKKVSTGIGVSCSNGNGISINQQQLFEAMDIIDGFNFYKFKNGKKQIFECTRIYSDVDDNIIYDLTCLVQDKLKINVDGKLLRTLFEKIEEPEMKVY